jgi:hypothetical protein
VVFENGPIGMGIEMKDLKVVRVVRVSEFESESKLSRIEYAAVSKNG